MFSPVLEKQPAEKAVLRKIYGSQIPAVPKSHKSSGSKHRSDYGWIYTSPDCHTYTSCRSYQTLFYQADSQVYYTPNTFSHRERRAQDTLRWLNAFVLDVDTKNGHNEGLILPDLLDRIDAAGLPHPSLVVRTPSGGYHVYFILNEPRKAYSNAVQRYQTLQRSMAEAIGSDLHAIGAERLFRIPNQQNIVFESDSRPSFGDLNDWYAMNVPKEREYTRSSRVYLGKQGLLQHPAFVRLLDGVEAGSRDCTAYTLALAYKVEGYAAADAEAELYAWNRRLTQPLSDQEIRKKIKSAYREGAKKGPKASIVTNLSGVTFYYGRMWEPAKPREIRKNSHFEEWAADIIESLRAIPGHEIADSQRRLAAYWGMSLSSFQKVVELLLDSKRVSVEVTGKGRSAKTILRLIIEAPVPADAAEKRPRRAASQNVPSSNTLNVLEQVVGGRRSVRPVFSFTYFRFWFSGEDPP